MVKDIKTAIVGGIVGCVILLTIFCCEGKQETVETVPTETEVKAVEELKESIEELIPEVEETIEEVVPEVVPEGDTTEELLQ